MKLTVCLFLVSTFGVFANSSYAQKTKLTLNFKETPLEQVLSSIEDQSEFYFLYSKKVVDVERKVNIEVTGERVPKILDLLLSNSNETYIINGRQIVLTVPGDSWSPSSSYNSAIIQQQSIIGGKITDSAGMPLPGVTVIIKGTTQGTITNVEGDYSISNIPAGATLVFSFVGMRTQEVTVDNKTRIDITMEEDIIGLEEVVAVGYGTQKKVNLTGAVSNVDSGTLENRPITNIGQGLQGLIPNLNITQSSGDLGRGTSFNIRGYTSISGGGPLILVDGIPMDINLLSPNDIESVTVLKDAASAAIYGARASYGVILVSTKRGKRTDKPNVSVSSNYTINKPVVFMEFMDSMEQMTFMNEGQKRASGVNYFDDYEIEAITNHYNNPENYPETFLHPLKAPNEYSYCANTNWPAATMKTEYPMLQNSATISGGTERIDYYASFNHLYQEGITKGFDEKFNRYNFMGKLGFNLTKWMYLAANISTNNSTKVFPPFLSETESIYHSHSFTWYPIYHPDGTYGTKNLINVVQLVNEGGKRERSISDSWLTGIARLTPIKNMTFNLDYSYRGYYQEYLDHQRALPVYNRDGDLTQYATGTYPDYVQRTYSRINEYVFNAFTDYENTFAEKHYFKAMVGFNQELRQNGNFNVRRNNLIVPTIPYYSLATGEWSGSDGGTEYAIRGTFSRINYIFDQRYFMEFNGRYDGSSKFPRGDRWSFFPSLALGWRIDNEAFFGGLKDIFEVFKLRGSLGTLGNQNVTGYYPYVPSFSSGQVNYILSDNKPMTVYAPGLVSPTLTWETVVQKNLGLDLALLDNKLGVNFDIYRRDTKNMLTRSATMPSILAVNEPEANAADLKTTGWDMEVHWKQYNQNLKWSLSLILSDNISKITKFDNPRKLFSDHYEGEIIGEIWGLTTLGFFKTDEEAAAADHTEITGRTIEAGDFQFADLDGDGIISRGEQTVDNPGDYSIIGNSRARYNFGVRPSLSWKNWNLDMLFQGVGRRQQKLSNSYYLAHYTSQWQMGPKIAADYWTPENTNARFPRPYLEGCPDVTVSQTWWLQNAAYVRLKQLNLGYTVPSYLTSKVNIEKLYIFFTGQNLFEFSGMIDKISDPEQSGANVYPLNRSIGLGINIDF